MNRYLSLFLLCSSLAHAQYDDFSQRIYEGIVDGMLKEGLATTLVCPIKATYTIELGMNDRETVDDGEKTIVIYIGDWYIFERHEGYLQILARKETGERDWKGLENTTAKVSEASIDSSEVIPQEGLKRLDEAKEGTKHSSWEINTAINRYTGAYTKKSILEFVFLNNPERLIRTIDDYVGTCTKADKAKF